MPLTKVQTEMAGTGSVRQVVNASNTTTVTISADGQFDVITASITVGNNSKICVIGSVPHYAPAASTWGSAVHTYLWENGTQIHVNEHDGPSIDTASCQQIPVLYATGVKSAGTYTYVVKGARVIGGTHTFNRDGRASNLVLMEIAA